MEWVDKLAIKELIKKMFENTLSLGNWSLGSNFSAPSLSSPCLGIDDARQRRQGQGGWQFGVATLNLKIGGSPQDKRERRPFSLDFGGN